MCTKQPLFLPEMNRPSTLESHDGHHPHIPDSFLPRVLKIRTESHINFSRGLGFKDLRQLIANFASSDLSDFECKRDSDSKNVMKF